MYHMKILLSDFNAKFGRQYTFKTTGNESSLEDSNDNGAKVLKNNAQLIKVIAI